MRSRDGRIGRGVQGRGPSDSLDLPGDLGLTAQFIGIDCANASHPQRNELVSAGPACHIPFSNGPQLYFEDGLATGVSQPRCKDAG